MRSSVVLCYHTLGDWAHEMWVDVNRLEQQVSLLLDLGWSPVTFSEAARSTRHRTFAITFDDGFRAVFDHGFPTLQRLGVVATAFLPTDHITSQRALRWPEFDPGPAPAQYLQPMSWANARALAAAGWEIGSHSRTHPRLTRLGDAALIDELGASREECSGQVGAACTALAYPFGDVDARVVAYTRRVGYSYAAGLSPLAGVHDVLVVQRTSVYRNDGGARFRAKISRPMQSRSAASLVRHYHGARDLAATLVWLSERSRGARTSQEERRPS